MVKRLVLLFSLLGLIFLGISTQVKKNGSKISSPKKISNYQKEDKLLEWMTFMKDEGTRFRNEGEIARSVDVLTKCIDERWREPNSAEEHEKLAWIYTNRAYLFHERQGDFLAAKEDYLSALKQFESCEPSDYLVARYVYQPLGNIYTRLGENEIALSMLEKFKLICEENGETEALMNSYNDIARTYLNTDKFEKAIELFTAGIELDGSDNLNLGLLYSSRAEVEFEIGKRDECIASADESIVYLNNIIRSTDASDYRNQLAKKYLISSWSIKALALGSKKDFKGALQLCEKVLEVCEEIYPQKHRARARALMQLGNSNNALGLKVKAMDYYQMSLQSMVEGVRIGDYLDNPSKTELSAGIAMGEVLIQKGTVANELFKESGKKSWLEISAQAYLTYFDWVEIHRLEQFELYSKLETVDEVHRMGESALNIMFQLYKATKDEKWIDRAFVIMDQTKAIILADERGFKDLADSNPEMRSLLKDQSALKYQRSLFKTDIETAESDNDSLDLRRLKKRLSEIDQKSQLLDQKLRNLFPSYKTQSGSKLEGEALIRLKEKIKSRDAKMFSYFLGDHWVYVIAGTPDKFEFNQIEREELIISVEDFMYELNTPNSSRPEDYAASGKRLFDLLVGPSNKSTKNWVISPDGMLNGVPFEALVSSVSKEKNSFKKMNYVVRNHVIHYAPSAFFFAHDNAGEKAKQAFLGIAPIFKSSSAYDYLPKSKEELESGASLFSGEELTGAKATKKQFFAKAEQYDILHISTHAGRNSGENNDAWMAFSDASSKDNKLRAHELLKLDLPASLVVLNACETGAGTVFKGEGPMSLARGFLDAGSQSTLTNLWRVNHESNALIMKSFYENLSETQSPSQSLNAAKLNYLSNSEIDEASAHPYYWSSAVLIGTDVSVVAPGSTSFFTWMWIALGSTLILVLGSLWYRKKRKSAGA